MRLDERHHDWMSIDRDHSWGRTGIMTENERRAQDVLTREDLVLRSVSVVGLIAMSLLILLIVNP